MSFCRRSSFPLLAVILAAPAFAAQPVEARPSGGWEILAAQGEPHARHECAFVRCGDAMYLLGGRRIQPVDRYDPDTKTWTSGSPPPVEVHHFQPVVWNGKILLAGAMTGGYPREKSLPNVLLYDPASDAWSTGPEIPEARRRGGAGCVVVGDTLYLVCGITDGHWSGHVAWLDALDLRTGVWRQLPDAPRPRDHFQAAVIDGRLYAVGGRRSSAATNETFNLVEAAVDVFDLATETWTTIAGAPLPTTRAGTATIAVGSHLLVVGGESAMQTTAHAEVEAFDTRTQTWSRWPDLATGRHGTGVVRWADGLYVASGCANRGGRPEQTSIERLALE